MTTERDKAGSVGMNISAAEHRLLDALVARAQEKAGRFARVTKASYLRQLMLEDGERNGLTVEMFKGKPTGAAPPGPAETPQPPTAAAAGGSEPPPADPGALTPDRVRAALKRAVAAGIALGRIAEEAGIMRPRVGEFQRGASLPFDNAQLPELAAALERLGHPAR